MSCILIDYLQLIQETGNGREQRYLEVGEITRQHASRQLFSWSS
ncbi:hypothetical protein GSM42_02425 [Shimazuella sp. KC615]|uniref:Uncharacterized protein n=1 Tax=Shimazuella alba TaxID=2690964 RepID=A0A6I4VVS8_9BACL|nr:DnaB-like helicase C-terminal domain-containing protein [Shimazuella alba]MXQ52624.1 hypothetical protein [Shimazuella alba]